MWLTGVLQLERASRLALELDGVSWALCHGRTPFIEMSLHSISLVNLRNRDQSGGRAACPKSACPKRRLLLIAQMCHVTGWIMLY